MRDRFNNVITYLKPEVKGFYQRQGKECSVSFELFTSQEIEKVLWACGTFIVATYAALPCLITTDSFR
jgi:hypothetical protein